MKLNLACGLSKLEGYLNVDVNPDVKPDLVADVCGFLPWEDASVDEIVFMHAIEHVQKRFHVAMLEEFHRILKKDGKLILGYPEFSVCVKYWLENHLGQREFWENCIYGRQLDPKDFHVCAMDTNTLLDMLRTVGFEEIVWKPENANPQYTVLKAVKGLARPTYEQVLNERIFGEVKVLGVGVGDQNMMRGS